MSGDGSSYSSRLSDGYVSNVRAWERTRHRKRERERKQKKERKINAEKLGGAAAGLWLPLSVPSALTDDMAGLYHRWACSEPGRLPPSTLEVEKELFPRWTKHRKTV